MKIYNLADSNSSGVLSVDELFKFISELGFWEEIDFIRMKFKLKYGEKISFYEFLSIFDFLDDAQIRFKWSSNLQAFEKIRNDGALFHIFKIRRDEYSKDAKEFEN